MQLFLYIIIIIIIIILLIIRVIKINFEIYEVTSLSKRSTDSDVFDD
jgi:hypothetical protein